MNPYEVLGLKQDATPDQVKHAYRLRAQLDHPDKNPGKPEFVEKFQKVQLAYEVLSDPLRRKKYDDTGSVEGQGEDLRTLAMQSIAGLALSFAEADDVQGMDVVAEIRKKIRELIKLHQSAVTTLEKRIARFERKMKRFKRKGEGDNIFTATFEHAIKSSQEELRQAKSMIRCGEIALEILADYEYVGGKPEMVSISSMLQGPPGPPRSGPFRRQW